MRVCACGKCIIFVYVYAYENTKKLRILKSFILLNHKEKKETKNLPENTTKFNKENKNFIFISHRTFQNKINEMSRETKT